MFREIRRKITVTNALIFVTFFALISILFGIMINQSLNLSGEYYLHSIADEIIRQEKVELPVKVKALDRLIHRQFGYEYIIWDSQKNAVQMRLDNEELIISGRELSFVTDESGRYDLFAIGADRYRVYSAPFENDRQKFVVQVFQNINAEQTNVQSILLCLLLFGIAGIIVLIPLSYYLAGKALKPIKENFENQKQFIADVSHELRTPLTVIQTNVEVLRMKEDEPLVDNLHWLNNISNEAETMSSLVSEMLLSAQADNKKIELKTEKFDLSLLCAEIVDLMYELAEEKQISLTSSIPTGIEYKGDLERLKRAIRILVDNAIKYTPNGGNVSLNLTESVRNVTISVQDNGVGLTKEEQKKVFTRFYRSDDARTRETGGVGLGLNIAYVIVQQHNGKIKIDSTPGEGSIFSIVLPKNN